MGRKRINCKAGAWAIGGVALSVVGVGLFGGSVFADGEPTLPTITLSVTPGTAPSKMYPSTSETKSANFYHHIAVTMSNTGNYTLSMTPADTVMANTSVSPNCGRSNPNCVTEIASLPANTQAKIDDEAMVNHWGYRAQRKTAAGDAATFTDDNKYVGLTASGVDLQPERNVNYKTEHSDYWWVDFGTTVDDRMAAGTYTNTVTVSAVATPIVMASYTINYHENAGTDTVTNMPATKQEVFELDEPNKLVTLDSATPSRDGWAFLGWATSARGTAKYQPGEANINIEAATAATDGVLDLYAVWSDMPAFFRITYMDEMSTEVCNSVIAPNSTTQVTETNGVNYNALKASGNGALKIAEKVLLDRRDGKSYVVRKMPDGNCWMAQNLDLDVMINGRTVGYKDGAGQLQPFESDNTNIASDYSLPTGSQAYATQTGTDVVRWNTYGCAGDKDVTTWSNSGTYKNNVKTWCPNGYELRSYDPGEMCYTHNTTAGATSDVAGCFTRGISHVGNYYNWPLATMGTGTYTSATTAGDNVNDSICPANWKLPTGSQKNSQPGQIATLLNNISGIGLLTDTNSKSMSGTEADTIMGKLVNPPYSLVRSGLYNADNGAQANVGTGGYFWSRTAYTPNYAYYLTFSSSGVYPGTNNASKGAGYPVRCVFVP